MPTLHFEGAAIEALEGTSVLDALQAAGVKVDSSCRAGVCQSCLLTCTAGELPVAAQAGLSKAQLADGGFLACLCVPIGPLSIARASALRQRVTAVIEGRRWLSPSVLQLQLRPVRPFKCRAGQFITLVTEDDILARSYSVAACQDGVIELQIRIRAEGKMSQHLLAALDRPVAFVLAGPSGSCCYEAAFTDRTLVLVGTGTGLAPLWGVLHDALAQGHVAPIRLYHGARNADGLYLQSELRSLQERHANFTYLTCTPSDPTPEAGELMDMVLRQEKELAQSEFFLCGDPALVNRMKRKLYLSGARLDSLHSDAFVPAAGR